MLDHPNLMKVYKLEVRRDWLFRPTAVRLLIEFAPGRALSRIPALPLGRALYVFERTAAALEHMHARGVLHADVKPSNVIYDPARGVKLIDFGLAWIKGERKVRVQGTPQYMAPETAAQRLVTPRTDVYNLGATMYHVVTGRALPVAELGGLPGSRVRPAPVTPVASLNPDAPAELCELIHRCISPDPDSRPGRMSEVRAVLHRLAPARDE
jgi:serine/threonine protein kinase